MPAPQPITKCMATGDRPIIADLASQCESTLDGPLHVPFWRRWKHARAEVLRYKSIWNGRTKKSRGNAVITVRGCVETLMRASVLHKSHLCSEFGYGLRRQIFFPLLGDGIFTQDGPAWKHSRELLRPQFARQQYRDLEIFRDHVDNLIERVSERSDFVDLQPLFFRFTLDTTTAFLFGESTYSLMSDHSAEGKKFAKDFDTAQDYVVKRFRLLDLYWLIGGPEFRKSCSSVQQFVETIIKKRQQNSDSNQENSSRYVFFDAVAQASQDRDALRDQLINILLAGRDTTACLLTWTL